MRPDSECLTNVRGAEDWIVAVNDVVRRYRGISPNSKHGKLGLREAVTRMRDLGLSQGDAIRWLEPRSRSAVHRVASTH